MKLTKITTNAKLWSTILKCQSCFVDHTLMRYFEKNQLPQLENESLRFYKVQLKFWENNKALAYYFFEHRNLFAGVKAEIMTSYNKFKEKYKVFCIDNLKNYFTNLDITNSLAKSSLSLQWENKKASNLLIRNSKERIFKN